ncbi:hypothetical protein VPNG_03333 [Cytospora leucostoma]|uniref:Uncharacterized protein n=1 Tax=Cytospora leucostoma TaxID=1230097 RepID=A0A423XFP2_9PEZI|nr:hypothetical protein VPNG_03333 [Cytospora leucostoma]
MANQPAAVRLPAMNISSTKPSGSRSYSRQYYGQDQEITINSILRDVVNTVTSRFGIIPITYINQIAPQYPGRFFAGDYFDFSIRRTAPR